MNPIDFMEIFNHQVSDEVRKATDLLLKLEKSPQDADIIHQLMRIFHSIKGASRAVNINDIKDITHRLEDIYQAVGDGKIAYHKSLINISFDAIDLIKKIVDTRKKGKKFVDCSHFFDQIDSFLSDQYVESDTQTSSAQPEPEEMVDSEAAGSADKTISESAEISPNEISKKPVDSPEKKFLPSDQSRRYQPDNTPAASTSQTNAERSDALMNLIGELTVTISSLEDQRVGMRHVLSRLMQLQIEISKLMEDDRHTELVSQILTRFRLITQDQTKSIEMLDGTENRLKFLTGEIDEQVTQSRLVELDEIFSDYPRVVRDLCEELNKKCSVQISGQKTRIDRAVLEMVRTPIFHILRNAVDHGIERPDKRQKIQKPETGSIVIHAEKKGSQICISISDDGCGIDEKRVEQKIIERGDTTKELWEKMTAQEKNQFLFLPGFTTTTSVSETSGRGMGLDIVKSDIEKMGGRVLIENYPGKGLALNLELPITLSLTPCILVKAGKDAFLGVQHYAFPEHEIDEIRQIKAEEKCTIEGHEAIRINNETIMLYDFCSMMNLIPYQKYLEQKRLLLLNAGTHRIGLVVDTIFEEQHIVIRSLDERLGKIPNVEGVTLLKDGNVALIVDIKDILQNVSSSSYSQLVTHISDTLTEEKKNHILVVEDSQTVREVERHFLESAGYTVTTAVNGVDGLNKLKSGHFDLIITDIDMPRMNGIEMIRQVRTDTRYSEIPVIVVSYKDRDADRQKADEVGVNLYVTKSEFDSARMLERIRNLL
ncbi:MAG: response regulator [Candidatus Magnetomorum sp.]|nr:response regulator [Candidatus Magnetomorum sp.]